MPAIDWMQKGPFGLMVHWLSDIAPPPGHPGFKDFNEAVDAFPVEQFCDQIAATGAGWLIFPFGQNTGFYCSPNTFLDEHLPGHCSKRDLFREIAEGITKRGLKMIAYLPGAVPNQKEEVRSFFGWDADPIDKRDFQRKYARMVRSWSESMGTLISAWWFDGAYECQRTGYTHGNDRFEIPEWGEAVRAGNPDSVYCLNPGANTFQYVSEAEGYLAGEARELAVTPGRPLIGDKQWHSLVPIDCKWMHKTRGEEIPPPRFTDRELHSYVHRIHGNGGGTTLNIGIYLDGTMPEASLAQVTRVAGWVNAGTAPNEVYTD
ncbi:MAG: alpha-L-fucosidase [Verrucomicrobia bacterium]|nr:alpha-L-fucosidase [Verrucomicrobiota bacterium]MCH8528646.1 alpha-L-fucosidase [Kiritimatiellia bacterium]